jgi:hypothetical protein
MGGHRIIGSCMSIPDKPSEEQIYFKNNGNLHFMSNNGI